MATLSGRGPRGFRKTGSCAARADYEIIGTKWSKIFAEFVNSMHCARRSEFQAPPDLIPKSTKRLAKVLFAALGFFAVVASAAADASFPFKSLRIDNLVYSTQDTIVFTNNDLDRDYPGNEPESTIAGLDVFESSRYLTWQMAGDFTGQCIVKGSDSGVAIVYGPSGARSGSIDCDGVQAGNFGPLRRILTGTYQANTTVSGNVVELTGVFTGRAQVFMRPSDTDPTYIYAGTVRQHGKFQITPAGCKVLLYETESKVREDYNDEETDYRKVTDKVWLERMTPTTACQVTR